LHRRRCAFRGSGRARAEGNGIGTLYFAEVAVEPGERSVTMLRIEFGLAASSWWHGLPPIIAV
jgi:hypothetical protein